MGQTASFENSVRILPVSSVEQDSQTLTCQNFQNVAAICLEDTTPKPALTAELKKFMTSLPPLTSRKVCVLKDVSFYDLTENLQKALKEKLRRTDLPALTEVERDIREYTLPRVKNLLTGREDVTLTFLFQRGGQVKPAKWHLDSHLPDGRLRLLRAVTGAGPDIAIRGAFKDAVHPDFDVESFEATPTGLCVFDGKNHVHRTPGMQSGDETDFRAAYVIT